MRLSRASLSALLVALVAAACAPSGGGSEAPDVRASDPDGSQVADGDAVSGDAATPSDAAADPDATDAAGGPSPDMAAAAEGCADEAPSVVELTCDDGVRLAADFHPGPATGR